MGPGRAPPKEHAMDGAEHVTTLDRPARPTPGVAIELYRAASLFADAFTPRPQASPAPVAEPALDGARSGDEDRAAITTIDPAADTDADADVASEDPAGTPSCRSHRLKVAAA